MDSPFNRSSRTCRTPPPTSSPAPEPPPRSQSENKDDGALDVISSANLQNWMTSIEQYLNEVCHIATEGKLNSDQKSRIQNLCRKVGNGTASMANHYQALKIRLVKANSAIQSLQDRCDLAFQLQELKASIKDQSKSVLPGQSFSDMVKKGPNNYFKPTNVSSVAIYPTDKGKSSEETKSLVQTIIRPEEMNLHVRGLRKTRNGGVIISTDRKEDVEKLKKSSDIINSGLTIDEPPKRKPRIVVIGVPSNMQEKDVFSCLFHQNLAGQHPQDLEAFTASIKLSHKSGKKDHDTCNYIIEVTAEIRKALIAKERVFVNWSSCPVRDFTLVTRCFKCQQYGHAAKTCREETHTCGHCGDQGHSLKECTKKAASPKCASCSRFKKPNDHITGAADCPAKIMAEKRYLNSIDYGGA